MLLLGFVILGNGRGIVGESGERESLRGGRERRGAEQIHSSLGSRQLRRPF